MAFVKYVQNLGARRNIESVLGSNLWLWCWPSRTPGTGLRFELAEGDGKWVELTQSENNYIRDRELHLKV